MLDYSLVKAGEEDVVLVVHLRYRNHEQAMLLAGIATYYRSAVVGPAFVGAQHFLRQTLLEIYHQALVKFKIAHSGIVKNMCSRYRTRRDPNIFN